MDTDFVGSVIHFIITSSAVWVSELNYMKRFSNTSPIHKSDARPPEHPQTCNTSIQFFVQLSPGSLPPSSLVFEVAALLVMSSKDGRALLFRAPLWFAPGGLVTKELIAVERKINMGGRS